MYDDKKKFLICKSLAGVVAPILAHKYYGYYTSLIKIGYFPNFDQFVENSSDIFKIFIDELEFKFQFEIDQLSNQKEILALRKNNLTCIELPNEITGEHMKCSEFSEISKSVSKSPTSSKNEEDHSKSKISAILKSFKTFFRKIFKPKLYKMSFRQKSTKMSRKKLRLRDQSCYVYSYLLKNHDNLVVWHFCKILFKKDKYGHFIGILCSPELGIFGFKIYCSIICEFRKTTETEIKGTDNVVIVKTTTENTLYIGFQSNEVAELWIKQILKSVLAENESFQKIQSDSLSWYQDEGSSPQD